MKNTHFVKVIMMKEPYRFSRPKNNRVNCLLHLDRHFSRHNSKQFREVIINRINRLLFNIL